LGTTNILLSDRSEFNLVWTSTLLKFFEASLLPDGLVSHSTSAYSCLPALALIPRRSGR